MNKDWHDLSKSSTQTHDLPDDDITEVEVNDLHVNKSYEFRGLFEDTSTGDIVQLNSEESIKIKSNSCFINLIFNGLLQGFI